MRSSILSVIAVALAPLALSAQGYDSSLYDALQWRNVGPDRGGRSQAVAGSAARPFEYYFGATGGGLWKTTDGGENWAPVTDGQLNSSSVGAVQVCEANPDVVYIGMGETELRGNIMQGDGVYKSTDGGETWRHVGLEGTQAISRIRIHPTDCNTVWVAAFGTHSIANADRGVFKSTNGGETWRKVLFRDQRSGAVDLTLDPGNPSVMYASLWEAWRRSWGMSSGGPGSGLFKSTDYGETWTEITRNSGLPQAGVLGKIGVAVSPAAPWRVYAIIEHEPDGGIYRSDDGGTTWTKMNDERRFRQRAFYYSRTYADPADPDVVYVLNTGLYRSTDGGKTFSSLRPPHGDNHDLWIAPDNPQRMINSNDGGANVSVNGGRTWTEQDYPTAQFYHVITTHHQPYFICGAQQDNSTACVPSRGWGFLGEQGGGQGAFFFTVGGGESGYIANDPDDPDVYFAGSYGGDLSRFDYSTGDARAINIWPDNPMGESAEDIAERSQWTFPIVFSHVGPTTLYASTQKVWKTTNEGQSWEAISPDLTRHDPSTMGPSGGPITKDQTGVETYATVFTIAPSYHDQNVIWAGSDDGLVHVTRDGGANWRNVTPPDAPDFVRINMIEASPTTAGKAYVAGIRYLVDNDRHPYVWRTDDYGRTWTKIVNGIPANDFVRAVREDPARPGLLYAASETTVYVSWDDGANWQLLTLNLPNTQVSDLVVETHDLVIATHGRSFWMLPNMDPLRQLTPDVADADIHLFDPVDPVRGIDYGVQVVYYLKQPVDSLTLEFLDADGNVIESYTGKKQEGERRRPAGPPQGFEGFFGRGGNQQPSVEKGSHTFTWNLRYPGYTDFEGRIFWAAGNFGPMAVPGTYRVRLVTGDTRQEQDFQLTLDPRIADLVTQEDLQARFDLSMRIRDRVSDANEAVIWIRDIKKALDDRLEHTSDRTITRQANAVKAALASVEEAIYQVKNRSSQDPLNFPIRLNNKLAALMGVVESGEARPTDQSYTVFDRLSASLQQQLDRLDAVVTGDLSTLNQALEGAGLEPVEVKRPERETP